MLQIHPWLQGWPLAIVGAVVLHLGALDESLLRPHDFYLCIKPSCTTSATNETALFAVWRSAPSLTVVYHQLDPDKISFSPIALEMLAEELPQLLQSLLVGVEHAINRVPLDELMFPTTPLTPTATGTTLNPVDGKLYQDLGDNDCRLSAAAQHSSKLILSPLGSPKCGLKRRELINKNKLSNKYALKRMSNKSDSEKNNGKTAADVMCESPVPVEPSNLPLFCLGRSFPHIDSDEESGDDTIKVDNGKYAIRTYLNILLLLLC